MRSTRVFYSFIASASGTLRQQIDGEVQKNLEAEAIEEWKARVERIPLLREEAANQMGKAQDKHSRHYNVKRRDVSYEIGDRVWRANYVLLSAEKRFTHMLAPRLIGPYTITACLGSYTYEIEDEEGKRVSPVYVSQLKAYFGADDRKDYAEPDATEDDEEDVTSPLPPLEVSVQAKSDPLEVGSELNASDPLENENVSGRSW